MLSPAKTGLRCLAVSSLRSPGGGVSRYVRTPVQTPGGWLGRSGGPTY